MPRMDEEIVELDEKYYKIGARAVFSGILYATITAITTIVLPLTSTNVFGLFGITFNPYTTMNVVVLGVILTILSFLYNLLYNAKPLYAGVVGILRYMLIFLDTYQFFMLFARIEIPAYLVLGSSFSLVIGALFLFPYWYGTLLLIVVGLNFIKCILQTAFWKDLRVKKKAEYAKK